MNEVNGVNPAQAACRIGPTPAVTEPPLIAPDYATPEDEVEISDVGAMFAKVQDLPEIRTELVARIRAEIEAGTYETPERLQGAIVRLLQDLI